LFQTLYAAANIKKITLEMYIKVQVDTDIKCLLFQKDQYSEFLSCYMWTDRHGEAKMCIFCYFALRICKN